MQYKVEEIGARFSDKGVTALADRFTANANDGYKFHSVISVTKTGCLGIGVSGVTYLAVYIKE
ncbi:hypothetical protein [Flammeovirga sp. OC4]|uniref:hypothetical protein n=1 Tax=Flammeovirga sp. OC4 TaxID=1382345 RepID=UPI0005C474B4|nr:hypothetical protein [Flammeovirga sp. OC4]